MRRFLNAGHKEFLMKKKIKSKAIKKTSPLAKSLGELMKDEDGFVSKETILKVGLSTVAALGIASVLSETSSADLSVVNLSSHNNALIVDPSTHCANHTNVTTHTSY